MQSQNTESYIEATKNSTENVNKGLKWSFAIQFNKLYVSTLGIIELGS